jgi:Ca2+:H+ antiporter
MVLCRSPPFAVDRNPQLLGDATEQLSMSLSQSVSALLNATFGNAVELLVGIVALQQDQLRLVQTSMLGSILSNILLVLGCSFAAAGTVYKESTFRMTAAQTSSGIMTLACVGLVIPAACKFFWASFTDLSSHNKY